MASALTRKIRDFSGPAACQFRFFWGSNHENPDNKPFHVVRPGTVSAQTRPSKIPSHIELPPYAKTGIPFGSPSHPETLDESTISALRETCRLAKEILLSAGQMAQPGVTTQDIDDHVFQSAIENSAYPSPLNYRSFPKSVCTSVNNVACHGIPDDRPLHEGDIVNIDITVFKNGVHGDCSETFVVGETDDKARRLVTVARECLNVGIRECCRPGSRFSSIGARVQKHARENGFRIIPAFTGHGIGPYFHGPPDIYHVANYYPGVMRPGMVFTVEPILSEGTEEIMILEDGWTALSTDDSRSAQFEHTVLITERGCEVLTTLPEDESFAG